MSTNATDNTEASTVEAEQPRYAELHIGEDEHVIYDRDNHQAWIQSTVAIAIDELR
jgi:hypothetical protein